MLSRNVQILACYLHPLILLSTKKVLKRYILSSIEESLSKCYLQKLPANKYKIGFMLRVILILPRSYGL